QSLWSEKLSCGRIDCGQRAGAVSDIESPGGRVIPHVVGVIAKPNDRACSIIVGAQQLQAFAVPVSNGYRSRVRRDGDALWLTESRQASQMRVCLHVEHFNRVVAKRRDKEMLGCRIEGKMLDTTLDARGLDRPNQCQ